MPGRSRHSQRGFYTPIATDTEPVIYAKVDKGKKYKQRGNEMNIFNTSSESSVRGDQDCDMVSVETPLVTSDDGRSSSNSDESKYNKMNSIQYDDRESRV